MPYNNIIDQNNSNYLGSIIDQLAKSIVDYSFDKIMQMININPKNNIDNGIKNKFNLEEKNKQTKNKILLNKTKPKSLNKFTFNNYDEESLLKKAKKELEEVTLKERKNKIFNYCYY